MVLRNQRDATRVGFEPLLSLIHINDLDYGISNNISNFANDTKRMDKQIANKV